MSRIDLPPSPRRAGAGRPWLSVVMPTYNGAAYLGAALQSIRLQNDPDIEIIAIDDGSTDDTTTLLRRAAADLPLRLIERVGVRHWAANSNEGLREARGEFISFLHQDDVWLPGRLDILREEIRERGDARLWLHGCWFIDAEGRRCGRWTCPLPARSHALDPGLVLERLLVQNWVGMPAPLFRRDDALAAGGLDETLWYTADWDLWLKLAAMGPTRYLPQVLASFRIHPASQTAVRPARDIREQARIVQERHFPRWQATRRRKRLVRAIAELSTDVNGCLAEHVHGGRPRYGQLLVRYAALGPTGWWRFWRDSRLAERAMARVRAGLAADRRAEDVAGGNPAAL